MEAMGCHSRNERHVVIAVWSLEEKHSARLENARDLAKRIHRIVKVFQDVVCDHCVERLGCVLDDGG